MRRIIIRIIFFILMLFIFDRTISFLISRYNYLLFNEYRLERPLKEFLEGKHYNTLILGTSRTYEGVHPVQIQSDKVIPFNWSFAGNGPEYNYHFYRFFKKHNGIPKAVIYGIDFFIYKLLSSPMELNELGIRSTMKMNLDVLHPGLILLKHKYLYDILLNDIFVSYFHSELSLKKKIMDLQNYTGADKSVLKKHGVHKNKSESYNRFMFVPPPGVEGEFFLKLLKELETDKVNVILLVLPDYIGTYKSFRFQRNFRRHLKKLKRLHQNIRVMNLDYPNVFDLHDESLFLDGGYGFENSHVSKKGARIIGLKLKKYLHKRIKF